MIHELKCDPAPFAEVALGRKTFELRKGDRPFRARDVLLLRETSWSAEQMVGGRPLAYTGREIAARILSVISGPRYGLLEGWVILSLVILHQDLKPLSAASLVSYSLNPSDHLKPGPDSVRAAPPLIGCAKCDRGDGQLGHADHCPKALEAVFTEIVERMDPNDGTMDPALPHHLLP